MAIILGTVWNGDFHKLTHFTKLSMSKTEAACILFTHNMIGVAGECLCIPFAPHVTTPNMSYRFQLYLDFLKANKSFENEMIMLTDIRDVAFLGDPFSVDYPDGLSVFLEDPSKTIGTCSFNSAWIKEAYGPSGLEKLKDYPISCAGVTIGDYHAMVQYLTEMVATLSNFGLNDQGIHNGLIRFDKLKKVTIFENQCGPVLTMGYMSKPMVKNFDGSTPLVVHQFDRHPSLVGAF